MSTLSNVSFLRGNKQPLSNSVTSITPPSKINVMMGCR